MPWPLIRRLGELGVVGEEISGYGCPGLVINGAKRWIGNGSLADVVVVWARGEDRQVQGFLVEKDTPGFEAHVIEGKGSLRAVWQAQMSLEEVRVPPESRLPGARSFKDAGRVLAGTAAHAPGRRSGTRSPPTRPRSPTPSAVSSSAGRCAAFRSSDTGWSRCSLRSRRCSSIACR